MKKYIFCLLFLFTIIHQIYSQKIVHAEILGRPTDKSIVVQAFFDVPTEVCVQYGTVSGQYTAQTAWKSVPAQEQAEVLVEGLKANTNYFYRLCYRKTGTTTVLNRPEHSFTTQRALGSKFSFVVQADPHLDEQSDSALYRLCLKNQLADAPDFMVDLGDFLMSDKLKNAAGKLTHDTVIYRSHLMRSYYETSCHSVPLFIALGNHEGEAGWQLNGTSENVAIWGAVERKKYFVNPYPDNFYTGDATLNAIVGQRGNYYAWNWGDALFIVLDPYWYTNTKPDANNGWRWTLGKTQYDWLKTTLEKSTATYKFVFAHQLIGGDPDGRGGVEFANFYEWGGKNRDGSDGFAANRPGWYKPIKDVLTENKVSIFFHGHDHFFGKQEKDCLIYQETPQPSHPNFVSTTYATDYGYKEGQILPNSGYIRVTVDGKNDLKVEYVRAYLPKNEASNRKNKDVSATYYLNNANCYTLQKPLASEPTMLWNSNYSDELVCPNPFQTTTEVRFTVAIPERLSLTILNEKGQLVKDVLSNNWVEAGQYQVVWDGKNNQGVEQPSGVYFYVIEGQSKERKSGKILLNR